ncbi:MAG: hypothetical protein ABMA01_00975 [Chthoniobacteraceae bacterium]
MNTKHIIPVAPPARNTKPSQWLLRTSLCAILVVSFAVTGCETPAQSALLGAAIGGGTGYVIGQSAQNQRQRNYDRGSSRDPRYDRRDSRGYYDRNGHWHQY